MDIHQLGYVRLIEQRRADHGPDRPTPYFAGERGRRRARRPGRVRRGMGRILVGAGQRLQRVEGATR